MWYVTYVCVDFEAYLPIQARNFISDHTIPWALVPGRKDGSPQRLRSCHLQWSPSWWGPKAGGVGEGLELRPARVKSCATVTITTTSTTTSTTTARPTRHHQVEELHGFSRGFREPFICHYYWENPRHYTPNLKKASPKFCDQKYRGRLNALHEVEILQVYHTFASALIPPKRVQFNEIHHNPVQHGLISIFTSWFNIDTLHDIKRDMFWTREEDWYPRPSKKQ